MIRWGFNKQLFLPLAAGTAFLCTATLVFADPITPTATMKPESGGEEKNSEDSQSFLRKYTWENSFDKAGDASAEVEQSLKGGVNYNCDQYRKDFQIDGKKFFASEDFARKCDQRQREANSFRKDAASIKSQQKIFADVSRVSDAAAVAAVGAVAYSELLQKKQDQSNTYLAAAKLQETAGIAAYTTGAADMSMGAWAYLQQKRKLEKMQETLNGKQSGVSFNSGNAALNSKLSAAIEKTKTAAQNHLLWGAGKVAAGYASMKLAKRSKQQAESMTSIDTSQYYAQNPPVVATSGSGLGTAGTFTPNKIVIAQATAEEAAKTQSNTGGGASGGSSSGSSSSTELKNSFGNRQPASSGLSGGGAGGLAAVGGGVGSDASKDPEADAKAEEETVAKTAFGAGEFVRGGGGPAFSGSGSGPTPAADDPAAAIAGMVAGPDTGVAVASQLNANQLMDEAGAGMDGSEQGSMAGVSGNRDKSLFDTIKLKHNKALQIGNLQGPAAVEVRN